MDGWKYYNHAMIPTTAPHEDVDITPIKDGSIWNIVGGCKPLLARWTSDYDCGDETEWWYCIKDTPFDIDSLKAKRRYEINRGKNNFSIRKIDARQYKNDIMTVTFDVWASYPRSYRPSIGKETFLKSIDEWGSKTVFGAFCLKTGCFGGYAIVDEYPCYAELSMQKVLPEFERLSINAALVCGILGYYNDKIKSGYYICDGQRNVVHITAFQDYLVKYFGFRKVYCCFHIAYRPSIQWSVKCVYPFRRVLEKLDNVKLINNVVAITKMENIARTFR